MPLQAKDIHNHFCQVGTWVDWAHTCDGFKYGDPATVIKGIAVGWQSTSAALREAQAKGCNLFITHEPTFYSHMDDDAALRETVPARQKMAFLDRSGLVVYRCHDVWDVFPKIGIVDAWSEFLELGAPIAQAKYYNLHAIPSTTAWELTYRLARRLVPIGPGVQFIGTRWQMVSRLAVGTGAITQVRRMVELGADVVLATDDGTTLWRDAEWMADLGVPLLIVNHMTAEIPGLRKLADYVREQFPGVPVEFVGPTCQYEFYATNPGRDQGIRMRLDSLENLEPVSVPQGYECRPMRADEAWAYIEVMNKSNFGGEVDQPWFERTFSNDPEYDPAHLQIIWKGQQPVAAAGAWHHEVDGERWGMIHWVGSLDSERGKGLGKAVTLAALHRLRERGFTRAMLSTGTWRLAAVAAYLRLGFKPWPHEGAPQVVWDRVLADLEEWRRWGRPRPQDTEGT